MRISLPSLVVLVFATSGCGLLLDRSYPDVGSDARLAAEDAALDALRVMDAGADVGMDAGADVGFVAAEDAPTPMDAPNDAGLDATVSDAGHDATVTMSLRDAAIDVGRSDAGIRTSCGNGVVEGGEECDLGPAGLLLSSGCDWTCHTRVGWSCTPPSSSSFPSALATERGESTRSAWSWFITDGLVERAWTTDEENCIIYPGRVGYLHSVELGQPGQDGWISPATGGCGVAEVHPAGAYNVEFTRDFSADSGASFEIVIGADNSVVAVYLDASTVVPFTDMLDPLTDRFIPRYRARITIPAGPARIHQLRIIIREIGEGGGIATGLSVNAWNPSVCTAVAPLP